MNKIKLIFATLFLLVTSSSLSAQSYDISSLTGKPWKAVSGYNYSDKVSMNIMFTNTSAKAFDESKVGKNTIGKYIMMAGNRSYKGKPYQSLIVYKIVSLTSNKLVVESGNLDKLKITYVSD